MKIGIIGGTSGIANKAYLGVYAKRQGENEFTLYSRSLSAAQQLRENYGFYAATDNLSDLMSSDLVMIHAATSEHEQLVRRFMEAGIPVFVDKPLTEDYRTSQALLSLSASKNVPLFVGFNRRFAPALKPLKEASGKRFVSTTKNLISIKGNPTEAFLLYDVFIHPLDTLLYLLEVTSRDELLTLNYQIGKTKGQLSQILLTLSTANAIGVARMNLAAGAYQEDFIVEGDAGIYQLSDLTALSLTTGIDRQDFGGNGWASASQNRGFDEMVDSVFSGVLAFDGKNREEILEKTRQKHLLLAHELIDFVLSDLKEEKKGQERL